MQVKMTSVLHEGLLKVSIDPEKFSQKFAAWKALGPAGEDAEYDFGKDAFYRAPLVNGAMGLRHVHLVPENDPVAKAKWDAAWARFGRRTSDNALVYAQHQRHGCLLIAVFWSPDAHEVPRMATEQHFTMMNSFAQVAAHFLDTGHAPPEVQA